MDYQKHYFALINRAKNRKLNCYIERHHITPKCIGGDDSEGNIVELTAEEHYTAHLLLAKIYDNEPKLIFAAHFMSSDNGRYSRKGNKLYGWVRRKAAIAYSQREITDEHREKLKKARAGKKPALGITLSSRHKDAMSNGAKNWHSSLTEEEKSQRYKNIWDKRRKNGSVISEETKRKISETLKRKSLLNGTN